MTEFTFQDFAREFTRLSMGDFKAAGERYFRYRGIDSNTALVEKHFLDFLHFLDLEEILQEYQPSVGPGAGAPHAVSLSQATSQAVPLRKGHPARLSQNSLSRVKRAFVKLKTIEVK